jgi:hypothetical protein
MPNTRLAIRPDHRHFLERCAFEHERALTSTSAARCRP